MRPRSQRRGRTSRTPAHTACSGTRRSASLLAASLHVALDELLCVFLEDVIDLVEELVDVFLDLLALLGQLRTRRCSVSTFRGFVGLTSFFFCSAISPSMGQRAVSHNS